MVRTIVKCHLLFSCKMTSNFVQATYDKLIALEFKNEILTLSMIEHLNLVRLYGYLEHGDERIIVVEYVGNGTLREHLDGKSFEN